MDQTPKLSVVIPCYNHGHFLMETIESVEKCPRELYELIVVDDGSTDDKSLRVFEDLRNSGYNVLRQNNAGVGAARNAGIEAAGGDYILPLDADNKIRASFMQHAVEALDAKPEIGIVHGDVQYFGDHDFIVKIPDFDVKKMIFMNYIDTCAIFRKQVWAENTGYDTKMPVQGIEDWDFWLNAHAKGWEFLHLDEIAFDYRSRKGSMLENLKREENYNRALEYLFQKYAMLMKVEYDELFSWRFHGREMRNRPVRTLFRLFTSAYLPKVHQRLYRL
jgi:glycosyltransferase involved in cell wall biosynthesis